jgi:hypothetical protein
VLRADEPRVAPIAASLDMARELDRSFGHCGLALLLRPEEAPAHRQLRNGPFSTGKERGRGTTRHPFVASYAAGVWFTRSQTCDLHSTPCSTQPLIFSWVDDSWMISDAKLRPRSGTYTVPDHRPAPSRR